MSSVSAPGAPIARLVRAASVSLWATLMAVGAHVAGSGEAPPVVALVPVVLAGGALAWWAAARSSASVNTRGSWFVSVLRPREPIRTPAARRAR